MSAQVVRSYTDAELPNVVAEDLQLWQKVASVRPGGKTHFYFRQGPTQREWLVWNRATKLWDLQIEPTSIQPNQHSGKR